MTKPPWWQTAFAEHYQSVYAHRDDASAADEIAGLIPRLQKTGGPVLDLGCGNGRHLTALRAANIPAFGCDFSADLLTSANARTACTHRLVRGDMRSPPFSSGWGAVLMLFTAFGYFSDEENARCLNIIGHLLNKDGWLIIDVPDPVQVARTLIPHSQRTLPDGGILEERRHMHRGRVEKHVIIRRDAVIEHDYIESVALYDREQFTAMALKQDLVVTDIWPSLQGPENEAQRLVYWLQRQ